MEAAAWRKGSEGSERGHDRTSGIAKMFCGVMGRAASGVCIFEDKTGGIGQHLSETRCHLRICLRAEARTAVWGEADQPHF